MTVSYHEGDPDKPFVSSSKANQFNQPPWKLPDNLALTGLRSRDLRGRDANHVLTDDTPGELQVQIASDHAQSRLVLGYNTRIDGRNGRSQPRGEGFELATGKDGVVRANAGMLVTTEARSGADAPAKDIGETVKRLIQARDTHETLAGLAQDHEAQPRDSNQKEVTKAIEAQNEAIRGETAAGHGKFPEFREPHLVLASPAGIETSTAGSTHIASSENLALTTGKHVSIASGRSLFASVLDAVSIFVHRAGMKLIAASGKIRIEAQDDNVEVIARKLVEIISGSDWINLKAVKGIRLNGGWH